MFMKNRCLVFLLLCAGLLPVAHASYRVTAFSETPGFEQIMAADYASASTLLDGHSYDVEWR